MNTTIRSRGEDGRVTPRKQVRQAAAYLRVSHSEATSHALETQEQLIRDYLRLHDITLASMDADDGVSGSVPILKRKGGAAAVAAACKQDIFIVSKLDRAGRDAHDLLSLVKLLAKKGTRLVSVAENFDSSTAAGAAMLGMLGVFAEFERNRTKERCRDTAHLLRASGRRGGGEVPFGYKVRVSGTTKNASGHERPVQHLVPEPREQKVIAAMFALRQYDNTTGKWTGEPLRTVAQTLNKKKLLRRPATPGGKGKAWNESLIHKCMNSELRRRTAREASAQ